MQYTFIIRCISFENHRFEIISNARYLFPLHFPIATSIRLTKKTIEAGRLIQYWISLQCKRFSGNWITQIYDNVANIRQ